MSKHDFSRSEFEARRVRLRTSLVDAELDWLVVVHPVSIHWLTGSDAKSYQEFQCLLFPARQDRLTVLTRAGEANEFRDDAWVEDVVSWGGGDIEDPVAAFAELVSRLGLTRCRVGMEVPAYYIHPHHYQGVKAALGAALVSEPSNLVHDLKLSKSETELAYIRRAVAIADEAMSVFATALAPGRSEHEVAGEVYRALLCAGSGMPASPINLVSGERSCFSHGAPTERRLREGDYGSVEYGAAFRRYTATIGRQFVLGPPTPRMTEIFEIVRAAGDACIAEIGDGVPAVVPHEAAKRVIARAGLEHGRVHTTGYGLAPGFPPTWGEPVHMIGGSEHVLRAGMVVSVEPPVFLGEERLGARIIDNVLVTAAGAELLTGYSRDLIVIG